MMNRLYFTVHRSLLFPWIVDLFTIEMKSEMSLSLTIDMTRWGIITIKCIKYSVLCWMNEFLSRRKIETLFRFNIRCYFISNWIWQCDIWKNSWMLRWLWVIRSTASWTFCLVKIHNTKIWFYLNGTITTINDEENSTISKFTCRFKRDLRKFWNGIQMRTYQISNVAEDWNQSIDRFKAYL